MKHPAGRVCTLAVVALAMSIAGCGPSEPRDQVVVYTALDSEFSQPIFAQYERETGTNVLARFDVESTKTVGLVNAIIAEAKRPRCDVFWNNEILNTLRLEEQGLLESYRPPVANQYPEIFRDPQGNWHGFAGRARILIVNTKLVPEDERPTSIFDMTRMEWRGKIGIAKPLFGTTATHAACLFEQLGEEKAKQFFRDLKSNDVQVMAGNKHVAVGVSSGLLAFGLTDTDDAMVEIEKGGPVVIVYPDREQDQLGTLFIPNTLAIIRGCPHPQAARQLVDYLLRPEIEAALAAGPSAQIPLNPNVEAEVRVETPRTVKAMPVDFAAAAKQWDSAARFIRDEFATAE